MLPIRNISYLLPMCCSFGEKCKNSPKTGLGCSTPLRALMGMCDYYNGKEYFDIEWHQGKVRGLAFSSEGGYQINWGGHKFLERKIGES